MRTVVTFTLIWLLFSEDLQDQTPYRLKDGDVITMGSTELLVHIADVYDDTVDKEN